MIRLWNWTLCAVGYHRAIPHKGLLPGGKRRCGYCRTICRVD
jgi:hypothetical protein